MCVRCQGLGFGVCGYVCMSLFVYMCKVSGLRVWSLRFYGGLRIKDLGCDGGLTRRCRREDRRGGTRKDLPSAAIS